MRVEIDDRGNVQLMGFPFSVYRRLNGEISMFLYEELDYANYKQITSKSVLAFLVNEFGYEFSEKS